jgi:GT2 family glycosyltransferase
MRAPPVFAVVLNHERPGDTVECLRSLESSTYPNLEIVVLDTGCVRDAAVEIRQAVPAARVTALERNLAYAGNNNVGLAIALRRRAAWIILLNDDVTVAPDCVSRLIEIGESDRRIGLLGPTVYHHAMPQVVQTAGGWLASDWSARFLASGEVDRGQYSGPRDVAWVSGCALMARGELCDQVGLLDERFFSYWEDVEWCLRARGHGWRVVHVPAAKAWHKGGGPGDVAPSTLAYYTTRNHLLALRKHRAPLGVWCAISTRLAATLLSWSLRPRHRSRREARTAMWHGLRDFVLRRYGERPAPSDGRVR